ncbi:tRNA (N6-threonylcarbamoyladenosine(37)-N6)-methyltransferase TrmO [Nocardia arthritidis]|uniref:tRNA (N6-threonylcarbamoyladenosine(37)-N6)-methyltransferase TrmO n=1 Tax=Nocardia arthritidis TaxID=228602 RepID=UPI001933557A|nr:tRNA (N6-threonylcarbamoyladenosine(37)-N6)-methyltransferase TrmO [Nocardia arthritidis]
MTTEFTVRPVGWVESSLTDRAAAPKQGDEGAPPARIRLCADIFEAAADLRPGAEVLVLTWLHQADRDVLTVRPRGDMSRPPTGVFATRSPARPNPIGLHRVTITGIDGMFLSVDALEAVDGTPVIDLKPVLVGADER